MSKGSRQRPMNKERFEREFERIFAKARKGKKAKATQVHRDRKKEAKKRGHE